MCKLLEKDVHFEFEEEYVLASEKIKVELIKAPLMATPYWEQK